MDVRSAGSPADLDEIRLLFTEFVEWRRQQQVSEAELVSAYFRRRVG